MKFIHAADLHIDSPMRNLAAHEGAAVQALQGATRKALENLVQLALTEKVAFVIIAGDLFDGQWQDITTGLWTRSQFLRLARAGILVYLLRGNHDAVSVVAQRLDWPENVRQFSAESPQTFLESSLGVAVHGQGFANRAAPDDLAAGYPERVAGLFNIGVLHTSLGGSSEHETYAPTTLDVLKSKGYDYWALGHVHTVDPDDPICEAPFIAWSGNTQGRSIRECGPKGVRLVEVRDGELVRNEFRATDSVRWAEIVVQMNPTDTLAALHEAVEQQLVRARDAAENRYLAVRLIVRGGCAAHAELVLAKQQEEALTEIRYRTREISDKIWLEQIQLETQPAVDLERLRQSPDLLGDLLRTLAQAGQAEESLLPLAAALDPLVTAAKAELEELGLDPRDRVTLGRWLQAAEGLILSGLTEENA